MTAWPDSPFRNFVRKSAAKSRRLATCRYLEDSDWAKRQGYSAEEILRQEINDSKLHEMGIPNETVVLPKWTLLNIR